MPLTCPRCLRDLSGSASDPGSPPAFCMFCGQRLRSSSGWTGTQTAGKPDADPLGQADHATRTFDVTPEIDPPVAAAGPPTEVAGFRIVRFLGAGGMGAVYEAEADATGQRVAIKLLSARLTGNAASVERFRQEGRVASQITHPRCVFVLRADTDGGRPFIVMELMPGTTLKDMIDEKGPLPATDAIARILDVIDGLAEAHRLGVIHRDVKPSNCFLTADDRVKVGDFGLSKSLAATADGGRHLTQTGAFLGTVLFASPEQIRGEQVGYDSDVYAVAGTLYYLLTGKAPYQHESMTAALAKAITEPPPPVREFSPDVPAELDAAVLKGLERDRDRRWQSLTEFGDALRDMLPENNRPARPRVLALAYLIDVVLLQFALVPLELLATDGVKVHPFAVGWTTVLVALGYFAPAEGRFGTTLGKKLLGLRVSRVGRPGPPGVGRAVARTAVFHAVLFGAIYGLGGVLGTVPGVGVALGLAATAEREGWAVLAGLGLLLLALQARRSAGGYRGVHDLLTGCHVTQRPMHAGRTRFVSRFPNPMDRADSAAVPLPPSVGGFVVQAKVCDLPDGGEAWAAEDPALGRRMLVRVFPPGAHRTAGDAVAIRPTRLRAVGHGAVVWGGGERAWAAFVAPAGAPLTDLVTRPGRPFAWADARSVIEQVTDELIAADADGSGVWRPTTDQVWVEPGGRVQLLDFPLPPGAGWHVEGQFPEPGPTDPVRFVRQVASLALEGSPRADAGPVRAPLPPHAATVLGRLFDDGPDGYAHLPKFWQDLSETHAHPAQVTAASRAAHLGVQAVLLAWGVSLMLTVSGLNNFARAVIAYGKIARPEQVRRTVDDASLRPAVLDAARTLPGQPGAAKLRGRLETALAPGRLPDTIDALTARVEALTADAAEHRRRLSTPEQAVLDWVAPQLEFGEPDLKDPHFHFLVMADAEITAATNPAAAPPTDDGEKWVFPVSAAVVVLVPVGWAGFAFLFRGGIAMWLAGITLVTADGRRAGRWRCAGRELLVWLPLTAVLLLTLWVQFAHPQFVLVRTVLWLFGVSLIPLYVVIALRDPARGPHDRLAGTYLVPV